MRAGVGYWTRAAFGKLYTKFLFRRYPVTWWQGFSKAHEGASAVALLMTVNSRHERWVKERVAEDPAILGLGDLRNV
jgi:hypothetical protein